MAEIAYSLQDCDTRVLRGGVPRRAYGSLLIDMAGREPWLFLSVPAFAGAPSTLVEFGPVGGGKSSIAERLKQLMEQVPFYALKGSPVNESPLGLFNNAEDAPLLEQQYGIAPRYLQRIMSPWAVKRLEEFGGDIRKFRVVKRYPSILKQCAIAKTAANSGEKIGIVQHEEI